ncbi:calcium-binding protein [Kordiimonas sp.]|uniref:calcium-binding protein n=1 Tax=Kordiimonas sp. TaxID=1970157 RepID=UPI003A8EDD57
MSDDGLCDIKISDFKGIFDLAYQIIGSYEFSWDELLERLLTFPLDDATKDTLRESIEIIKDNPDVIDLSKEKVDEYFAEYGDITLCELSENLGGDTGGSGGGTGGTGGGTITDLVPGNPLFDAIQKGANGNDQLFGDAINDRIQGLAGDDTIAGGAGSDVLFGKLGDDIIYADDFESALAAVVGVVNKLWGGAGNDSLYGGGSSDVLGGGAGDDYVEGGAGDDTLFARDGADEMDGGAGDDLMFGGAGDDFMEARDGDDTLWGGAGNDNMDGGAGADTFGFNGNSGDDEVWSFNVDEDALDLSGAVYDFIDMTDVAARSSTTTNAQNVSGVMIDLGGGNSVWLAQVDYSDISNVSVVF